MAEISRLALSFSVLGVKALERFFRASVHISGTENIPDGIIVFCGQPFYPSGDTYPSL